MDIPKYKSIDIDLLIPYARNSRTHSDSQVTKIASSIKEFGFLNPVIVDRITVLLQVMAELWQQKN